MSDMKIGDFTVVGTLGTGAHSTILHIRRSADSRNYALKVVPIDGKEDHKYLEQAQLEYRVGQLLDHPNLVKIHALEMNKDWLFRVKKVQLLIEYVNGTTLDSMRKLKLAHLIQIFKQVAAGVGHMHERRVCHADLKPNNIMLSRAGQVKVIDYGLAWIKGEGKGRVQGTPEYMAPEQSKHKMVNERSDIYNFGAMMYRMLTWRLPPPTISLEDGGVPIDGKTWKRLFKPVREQNASIPKAVCDLVHACLSYKAMNRPENMAELEEKLGKFEKKLVKDADDELVNLEW